MSESGPVPGGRPGEVERATALSGELSGQGVHGVVLSYVDTAGAGLLQERVDADGLGPAGTRCASRAGRGGTTHAGSTGCRGPGGRRLSDVGPVTVPERRPGSRNG